ncbi:hypothetical protein [Saccharospirillum salsuginis]|nr:hypothetical protein [Saccharospirillum salsuginis]
MTTAPASFRLTPGFQRVLMASVFFVGISLLVLSVSALAASLLGLFPVQLNLGIASLLSGVAAIGTALGLAS